MNRRPVMSSSLTLVLDVPYVEYIFFIHAGSDSDLSRGAEIMTINLGW
jgi:hypothetical protein